MLNPEQQGLLLDLLPLCTPWVQQLSPSCHHEDFAGGSLWRQEQHSPCHSTESPAGFPARAFQGTPSFPSPGLPNVSASWRETLRPGASPGISQGAWQGWDSAPSEDSDSRRGSAAPKHHLPSLHKASAQPGRRQQRHFYLQPIPLQNEIKSCAPRLAGLVSELHLWEMLPGIPQRCLWPGGTGKMFWPFRAAKTCLLLTLCSHGQAATPRRNTEVELGMCQKLQ